MKFWNLMPDAEIPEDGVLDIEGPIEEVDWWGDGTGSREFLKALKGMRNVTVHINSPGGDVMAGAEIYSALREHSMNGRGKVTVIVTALAASAASVVAMAGDEILISPVAYMMIHNPWTIAMGDAREMRKTAKTLDEIAEGLITAYQQRTGKSRDQLKRMLESETWMSAQTCVDEGFADGIYGGELQVAACASMMTRATPESIREMCARWEARKSLRGEDPEEDEPEEPGETENPDEEEEKAAERSENRTDDADPEEDGGADPDGDDPENPDDPEEPDEETEAKRRAEIVKRAEIARRAGIAASAGN